MEIVSIIKPIKMNKLQILFFILSFAGIFISCNRTDDVAKDIYERWEILDMMSVESVLYAKENNYNPQIEFYVNGSVSLKLDANNCIGDFTLTGQGEIKINLVGCTEICCDSDFSKKIQDMLSLVKSYSIEGNKMKLNVPGWGWINLKLYN